MSIFYALAILLLGAALCFGLSRALPTRLLGVGAALCCFAALIPALGGRDLGASDPVELLSLGAASFSVAAMIGTGESGIATALLVSAGVSLLALAGAVAGGVRGFGTLFGWALLTVSTALLSLAAPPTSLLQPLTWAVLAITGYGALRSSGAEEVGVAPPLGLAGGLLASAILTAALLDGGAPGTGDLLPTWPAAVAGLLAALALTGSAPFLGLREEAVAGPAPLGALLYGLCAPVAGLGWLLRATAELPLLPTSWAATLGLLGALGALACGAGALGERRLRPILAWTAGAQAGLVLAATGLAGPLGALAGPALLSALMPAATVGAAAALSFERATGDDNYTAARDGAPRLAVLFWAVAAVASLGLPPLWGFWGRLWLFDSLLALAPWAAALLVAAQLLLFFALLTPLGRFWSQAVTRVASTRPSRSPLSAGVMLAVVLLLLGLAPQLAWQFWLRLLPFAPPELPLVDGIQFPLLAAAILLIVVCWLLWRRPTAQREAPDPDSEPVVLAPDALAAAITPLAAVGKPSLLVQLLYEGLVALSKAMSYVLAPFEQRYYLLGVLVTLICVMLLMAL
jgi:hypothetical protein